MGQYQANVNELKYVQYPLTPPLWSKYTYAFVTLRVSGPNAGSVLEISILSTVILSIAHIAAQEYTGSLCSMVSELKSHLLRTVRQAKIPIRTLGSQILKDTHRRPFPCR